MLVWGIALRVVQGCEVSLQGPLGFGLCGALALLTSSRSTCYRIDELLRPSYHSKV
jgi:hypothetical protein